MTMLCVWLGYIAKGHRDERRAAELLKSRGATILLDYQDITSGPNGANPTIVTAPVSPIHEYFSHVAMLDISDCNLTEADAESLSAFSHLEVLWIERSRSPLGARVLSYLGSVADLRELDLTGSAVADQDTSTIATLPNLGWLCLGSTEVTDSGIDVLAKCSKLQYIDLTGTKVTEQGIRRLQAALPSAEIDH